MWNLLSIISLPILLISINNDLHGFESNVTTIPGGINSILEEAEKLGGRVEKKYKKFTLKKCSRYVII